MRLTDVLGCRVETESGERLGYVFDVRVERRGGRSRKMAGGTWWVAGLLVGRRGLVERLAAREGRHSHETQDREVVPWKDIVRAAEGTIVVRGRAGQ